MLQVARTNHLGRRCDAAEARNRKSRQRHNGQRVSRRGGHILVDEPRHPGFLHDRAIERRHQVVGGGFRMNHRLSDRAIRSAPRNRVQRQIKGRANGADRPRERIDRCDHAPGPRERHTAADQRNRSMRLSRPEGFCPSKCSGWLARQIERVVRGPL